MFIYFFYFDKSYVIECLLHVGSIFHFSFIYFIAQNMAIEILIFYTIFFICFCFCFFLFYFLFISLFIYFIYLFFFVFFCFFIIFYIKKILINAKMYFTQNLLLHIVCILNAHYSQFFFSSCLIIFL